MFRRLSGALKEELHRFRHERILDSMTEMEQFRDYVIKVQPQEFLRYQAKSPQKRLEFDSVIGKLGLNLEGLKVLDIGPGYGDSLDVCYERGARSIEFVEIDSFFFTYNRLKRFTRGYRVNHLTGLGRLGPGKFDLVWIKGSVSADLFIAKNEFGIRDLLPSHWRAQLRSLALSPRLVICPPLSHWLTQLESLASSTCQFVMCPHWLSDNHGRRCKDVHNNWFTSTMLDNRYVILPKIGNHNCEPEYPITFYKNLSFTSRDGEYPKKGIHFN